MLFMTPSRSQAGVFLMNLNVCKSHSALCRKTNSKERKANSVSHVANVSAQLLLIWFFRTDHRFIYRDLNLLVLKSLFSHDLKKLLSIHGEYSFYSDSQGSISSPVLFSLYSPCCL